MKCGILITYPIYMTLFLSNISDVMFDVSFDKSYSVVKNVSEIYV